MKFYNKICICEITFNTNSKLQKIVFHEIIVDIPMTQIIYLTIAILIDQILILYYIQK